MATDFQKLRSGLIVKPYDFDPDATSATDIGWYDAQDIDCLLVQFIRTVGTSDLTFTIIGNTAADGSGTDSAIKTITLAAEPNAFLDTAFGEVTRGEIMQAAATAGREIRGVSAALAFGTGTDEGVVNYIIKPTHVKKDNTADIVA